MSDVSGNPVFHDGRVHVKAERCSTCVFRPGNLMGLAPGRLKEMIEGSIEDGAGITCHKTLPGMPDEAQRATCRGYYDSYAAQVPAYRLAMALDIIEEVD